MDFTTPDLCDEFPDDVQVLQQPLNNYGGRASFHGEVVTISCFEDNSRVKEAAAEPGHGRVLVVDGGGSLRRALLGDMIAETAMNNGWQGFIIHGAIRDVTDIARFDLGVKALGTIPLKTERLGKGERDTDITIGGVKISSGMYVYADANGVVIASRALL